MPVTMGGMSSGIDTDGIIKKLVDVEARPIKKLEFEKKEYNQKKRSLHELGSLLKELDKAVKNLYGFRASYDDKNAISSNPQAVEAIANKFAEKGLRKVEVLELASTHKIVSDTIEKNFKIPSGVIKITVNGTTKSVKFRGGAIEKLKEKINEVAGDFVAANAVNTTGDKYVITLESKVPGKKGEILLSGDTKLLKNIGLAKDREPAKKDMVNLIFDNQYFTSYIGKEKIDIQKGSLNVDKDGKSISVKGVLWREYILPNEVAVKKETVLEFDSAYKAEPTPEEKEEALPYKLEVGPDITTVIKGIELHSYNISRERPLKKKKPVKEVTDVWGVGIVTMENNVRQEKIYRLPKDAKGRQTIPIGADFAGKKISKVIFYCNEGEVQFANAQIATPQKPQDGLVAKNIVSKAQDAKFKVDGIELVRDKNEGINDAIKGLTLNLKGVNPNHPAQLTIDYDYKKSIDKINRFIELYNKYIDYHRTLTKASIVKDKGKFNKVKNESGLFVSDMTLLRLQDALHRAVGGSYPSRLEKPLKLLVQVGVSTGKINSAWEDIKEGKLQFDEDVFRKAIAENPQGVKELFGSDNDGDNRVDNGFGFTVERILNPYVRSGKNIIATKIELQDESIKRTDERIARMEDHLQSYEEKLRKKFAAMEKAVTGAKAQGNWLKQQMNAGGSKDK